MIHSMSELTRRVIRQTLKELRVSMPARVVQYNAARQMAQVEIVQPELGDDGEIIMQPVIAEVPVSWPRAGGAHLTFPVSRGDTGIVVFTDRDIGGWVADGDTSAPESERRHSISDAVFIPGVQGGGVSASGSDVELQYRGSTIHIRSSGDVDITAPNVTIDASQTTVTGPMLVQGMLTYAGGMTGSGGEGSAATITGTVTVDGDVVANGISLTSHVHGGVETGPSNTQGPQ